MGKRTFAEDQTEEVSKPELVRCEEGLALVMGDLRMICDFREMLPRLKNGRLQGEMLVKAAKLKNVDNPVAVDATAGMGEDAILLAAAGFNVKLYEYDMVIAALLEDALMRARDDEELAPIVSRMELHKENSIEALKNMEFAPDVVFLDPMFPARSKSGLIKKKFQLLQRLESPCCDERELLEAAMASHPKKIIIKRPAKGPYLGGVKPDYTYDGKAIRYDCMVFARVKEE